MPSCTVDELVTQMLDFSETVWGWTEGTVGSWRTYERYELEVLARAALDAVPEGGSLLEIGVFGGLSTSILLQVARERKAKLWACDPFHWVGELARPQFYQLLRQFADVDVCFREMTSEEFRHHRLVAPARLDFIHIDGDHNYNGVVLDCKLWLPLLRSGGIACFHDYNTNVDMGNGLRQAVDEATEGWEQVALVEKHWGVVARRKM